MLWNNILNHHVILVSENLSNRNLIFFSEPDLEVILPFVFVTYKYHIYNRGNYFYITAQSRFTSCNFQREKKSYYWYKQEIRA